MRVRMGSEKEEETLEDERREEAIASTLPLQPGFKPKRVNKEQLSKLQELHKRRLQLKSKVHKKSKGISSGTSQPHGKDLKYSSHKDPDMKIEDKHIPNSKGQSDVSSSSLCQDHEAGHHLSTTNRRKLHWGLDVKERWERKANM